MVLWVMLLVYKIKRLADTWVGEPFFYVAMVLFGDNTFFLKGTESRVADVYSDLLAVDV